MSLVGWSHIYRIFNIFIPLDFILFWRSKQAQMSNCPLRFARENKKLLADSMRLEQVVIDDEYWTKWEMWNAISWDCGRRMTSWPSSCLPNRLECGLIWTGGIRNDMLWQSSMRIPGIFCNGARRRLIIATCHCDSIKQIGQLDMYKR